ncbi:MAG: condensation domain-containing protein [Jatrophihabitans sp.]
MAMSGVGVSTSARPPDDPAAGTQPADLTTGPLTLGQLAAWRDASRLPRERWHEANVFHTFELSEPVSRNQLSVALARLDAKHESLRTIFELDDPPRQRLLPARPAADVEVAFAGSAGLAQHCARFTGRPFDLTRDRPIRVLAIAEGDADEDRDRPNLIKIMLCAHHIACDGWSIGLLMTDLAALLGAGSPELPPTPSSLVQVAWEQRTAPAWQRKLKASQQHFRTIYQTPTSDFRHRDATAEVLQVTIESRRLAAAANRLASAHKVSPATVFTTAFLDAVAGFCQPGPLRIGLMSSNRFLDRWRYQVSSMNQIIPIIADPDPAHRLGERLARIQVAAMRAYRLGIFDVDQISPAALGLPDCAASSVCIINIARGAPAEYLDAESDELPVRLHWEQPVKLGAAGCNLRVFITAADSVRLRLRTSDLSRATAAAIVTTTYRRVIDSAAGESG